MPFSVRKGINIFLAGFDPTTNMRFRDYELTFSVKTGNDSEDGIGGKRLNDMAEEEKKELEDLKKLADFTYPAMTKTLGSFSLKVEAGTFSPSETIVMLGQNGTGKTTMIKMLAGLLNPDGDADS
jgi:ATP-binding cassette subfamily E protein 1